MDYKILYFVIFCVGSVADALKMNARDVYQSMTKGGIISDYIVPCYDVLHTFSREYIVEDLVDLMTKKGVLKAVWYTTTLLISLLDTVDRYLKFIESVSL